MRLKTIFGLLCAVLLSAGCAVQQPVAVQPPAVLEEGGLLLPGGVELSDTDFVARMTDVQFILAGELHNSFCDHLSQASILDILANSPVKPVLGLEMVSKDKQPVLDKFNAGEISLQELPQALGWKENAGLAFDLYRPVFEVAKANKVPVYGLNIPRRIVSAVRNKGIDAISAPSDKQWLPKHLIMPMPVQLVELEKVYKQHLETFGKGKKKLSTKQQKLGLQRFILAQSLWDSAMAENAVAVNEATGRPVLILAGAGHVDYGWGIAYRIASIDMTLNTRLIAPWRFRPNMEPNRAVTDQTIPPKGQAHIYYYCPLVLKSRLGMTLAASEDAREIVVLTVAASSPAEISGLKEGDVILKANERPVSTPYDLHLAGIVAAQNDGKLELLIKRAGKEQKLELTLPKRPAK